MRRIITVKQSMSSYAQLSRYYDLENADRVDDLPLWADLAREASGPVLELGCGSGRVALFLAREGFETVGVDNSPEMLALAGKRLALSPRLAGGVKFVSGDFRTFHLDRTFPLILAPFNTFAHLVQTADIRAALATVRRHLTPAGRVALELPNPAAALCADETGLALERSFRDEERGVTIQQFSSLRVDRAALCSSITWIYDEIDAEGRVTRTTVPMTLRYFFPAEISLLFELEGLRATNFWGDYDRSLFEDNSPTLIAVGGPIPLA
jgi:SAM-dependent methyltransferase